MQLEIITKADLQHLRDEIMEAIRTLTPSPQPSAEFLRSTDVRSILKCSHATLQNLRINGILKPSKIGGTWYYKASEVLSLLDKTN